MSDFKTNKSNGSYDYMPSTIGNFGSASKGTSPYLPTSNLGMDSQKQSFYSDNFNKSTAGGEHGFQSKIGGDNNSSGSGFGVMDGVKIASAVGNLWLGFKSYQAVEEQNALARESFQFNKDLSTKNFNIAKEDRDRRIQRSDNISSQYEAANQRERAASREREKRIGTSDV